MAIIKKKMLIKVPNVSVSPVKFDLDIGKKKKAVKVAHLDLRHVIKKIKRQEGKKEKKRHEYDPTTYWGVYANKMATPSTKRLTFPGSTGQPPGDAETRKKGGPSKDWIEKHQWWARRMEVEPTQRGYRGIVNIYEFTGGEGKKKKEEPRRSDMSNVPDRGVTASQSKYEAPVVKDEPEGVVPGFTPKGADFANTDSTMIAMRKAGIKYNETRDRPEQLSKEGYVKLNNKAAYTWGTKGVTVYFSTKSGAFWVSKKDIAGGK